MTLGAPWELIWINFTGRHPKSRNGNYYNLTYVDYFTKFAEAFPIMNMEATVLIE